jgi:5'-nucleotidase
VKGIKVTTQGMGTVKGITVTSVPDPDGENYYWLRIKNGDQGDHDSSEAFAVENGYISVTPLDHERTSDDCRSALLKALAV